MASAYDSQKKGFLKVAQFVLQSDIIISPEVTPVYYAILKVG